MEASPSTSTPHRPSMSSHTVESTDGLPTRFRRQSSNNSVLRLDPDEIREREHIVNAYEAEEERLVNFLGKKMEQLRSENTNMHNTLEGEQEAIVNRLQRQVSILQAQLSSSSAAKDPTSPSLGPSHGSPAPIALSPSLSAAGGQAPSSMALPPPAISLGAITNGSDPLAPSPDQVMDALRRENESLRSRVADVDRAFIHVCHLSDAYREELISLRTRLAMPTDDLILPPASPSLASVPISSPHHRSSSGSRSSRSGHRLFTRQPSSSSLLPGAESALDSDALASPSASSPAGGISLGMGDPIFAGSPEVERRLSFGQGAHRVGGREGARVAERGVLRRAGSSSGENPSAP